MVCEADIVLPATFRQRVMLGSSEGESVSTPDWFENSYNTFREIVSHPDYPCYLGTAAEQRGELYYTYVSSECIEKLPVTLERFLRASHKAPRERRNLTVFFEPDKLPRSHDEYRRCFWSTLQFIHAHDPEPWPEGTPVDANDPCWEFAFFGHLIFTFCAAPSYRLRSSRNLGPGMVILMQPRESFFGIESATKAGMRARDRTRERLSSWDNMAPHPDLKGFGEPGNREWKQYFLPDSNEPVKGCCPFAIRSVT